MTGRPPKLLRPTAGSAAKNRPSREPLRGSTSRVEVDLAGEAVAPADPGGDRLAQLVGAADLADRCRAAPWPRPACRRRSAGIASLGSPEVISIGFLWPGVDAVEQAAVRVKDDRTAPWPELCEAVASAVMELALSLAAWARRASARARRPAREFDVVGQSCVTRGPCARPPRDWRRSCGSARSAPRRSSSAREPEAEQLVDHARR